LRSSAFDQYFTTTYEGTVKAGKVMAPDIILSFDGKKLSTFGKLSRLINQNVLNYFDLNNAQTRVKFNFHAPSTNHHKSIASQRRVNCM
jgi:hypothetical protein